MNKILCCSLLLLSTFLLLPGNLLAADPPIQEVAPDKDFGMGPPATPAMANAADAAVTKPMAGGPFQPTWASVKENYRVPAWFNDAKFGLMMHWGAYSVPAYHNEWYEKHMYNAFSDWHVAHFGPQAKFGYKDFLPLFKNEKFNPDEWAELFKKSGARYVVPTAEHHDNFALWDSQVTPINAKNIGAKRDLIGDLCVAVRKQGLKFGVSNHGIENFVFINPKPEIKAALEAQKADLYDPAWAEFYHVADRSDAATVRFLTDWVNRNLELIDKYQPDVLWFDNGVNNRVYDPLKLRVAAYYYNSARAWNKEVTITTKKDAYAPDGNDAHQIGAIVDFEKVGSRSPAGIRTGPWQVDDPIGSTWGYTSNMKVSGADTILFKLIDTVSKNGNYLLNLSPMADGTIPEAQKKTLLEIGQWLSVNGEAIYGTHNWVKFGEGEHGAQNWRFTVKGDTLYAIALGWPKAKGGGDEAVIASLGSNVPLNGKIEKVELLGSSDSLEFQQVSDGLHIKLPPKPQGSNEYTFKITGLKPQ